VIKVCDGILTGRWFSPGPPVSSTNKTDPYDIAEILLKVALKPLSKQSTRNIKKPTPKQSNQPGTL
jgi:hypothetical protein